ISGALMIFYSAVFAFDRVKQLTSGEALLTDTQLD
ncbi:TRAP transporter small permease, partial [Vibrio owensii]